MLELIKLEAKKINLLELGMVGSFIVMFVILAIGPQKYSDVTWFATFGCITISMECFSKIYCKEAKENSLKISMVSPYGKKNVLKAKILLSVIRSIPILLSMTIVMFLLPFGNINEILMRVSTQIIFNISIILLMIYSIIRIYPKGASTILYNAIGVIMWIGMSKIEDVYVPYSIIAIVSVLMGVLTIYLYTKNFNKIAINQEVH